MQALLQHDQAQKCFRVLDAGPRLAGIRILRLQVGRAGGGSSPALGIDQLQHPLLPVDPGLERIQVCL
jgi:hypothetical protein